MVAPVLGGHGNLFALNAFEGHTNLVLLQGARLSDSRGLVTGTGKAMRHLRIEAAQQLKDPAVKDILRSAVKLDREVQEPAARRIRQSARPAPAKATARRRPAALKR